MKLYFNANFEVVKEEQNDAHMGSSNFDELIVYLDSAKYNEIISTTGGSVYPTYAAELPSGIKTPEVGAWNGVLKSSEIVTGYNAWKTSFITSVLSEEGAVQLTISFKIKNGTTIKVIRSCKAVLVVHDTIVSSEDAYFVDSNNVNGTLRSFKEIVEKTNEEYANKMNADGSNAADTVEFKNITTTGKVSAGVVEANTFNVKIGAEYVDFYDWVNTNKADKGDSYLKSETYSQGEVDELLEPKATTEYVNSELVKKADKNGNSNEDFHAKKMTSSDVDTNKGVVSQVIDGEDTAIVNLKWVKDYVESEFKKATNHIVFGKSTLDDKTGKITIPYTLGGVASSFEIDTNTEAMIKSQSLKHREDGTYYIEITYYDETKQPDTIELNVLQDIYISGSNENDDVIIDIEDGVVTARVNDTFKGIINAEQTRETNEGIRRNNETDRKNAEIQRGLNEDERQATHSAMQETLATSQELNEVMASNNEYYDTEIKPYYNDLKGITGSINALLEELLGGAE